MLITKKAIPQRKVPVIKQYLVQMMIKSDLPIVKKFNRLDKQVSLDGNKIYSFMER